MDILSFVVEPIIAICGKFPNFFAKTDNHWDYFLVSLLLFFLTNGKCRKKFSFEKGSFGVRCFCCIVFKLYVSHQNCSGFCFAAKLSYATVFHPVWVGELTPIGFFGCSIPAFLS